MYFEFLTAPGSGAAGAGAAGAPGAGAPCMPCGGCMMPGMPGCMMPGAWNNLEDTSIFQAFDLIYSYVFICC